MPINTDLNITPYHNDYSIDKKYYKVLFKPGYALQARELTQLQSILQNQIEQFGDNIFKEGSIIKGCSFTDLKNLSFVKLSDGPSIINFVDRIETDEDGNIIEYYYELENETTGLRAYIVSAEDGFQFTSPDLRTFFINYLNTSSSQQKEFVAGEALVVKEYRIRSIVIDDVKTEIIEDLGKRLDVTVTTSDPNPTGKSYGLSVSEGVIFQKGYFLYTNEQTIILQKYMPLINSGFILPHDISVGFYINEEIITSQQDTSLLDNANGSPNENAPGADRLKLSPVLVYVSNEDANNDSSFFALRKYENGSPVVSRDVSQYNVIGTEMAKRTFEESGDYVTKQFALNTKKVDDEVYLTIGPGIAYSKGYRIENRNEKFIKIPEISEDSYQTLTNQQISFNYGGYVNILDSSGDPVSEGDTTGFMPIESLRPVRILKGSIGSFEDIGSAIVRNVTNNRIYLYAIRMKLTEKFENATALYGGNNLDASINTSTPINVVYIDPVLNEVNKSSNIFDIGTNYLKSVDPIYIPVRRRISVSSFSSNSVTITAKTGEIFNTYTLSNIVFVSATGEIYNGTNGVLSSGNTQLTFDLSLSSGSGIVYYNAEVSPTSVKGKESLNVYVSTEMKDSKNKFSLGVADVYKIHDITDNSGNSFVESFVLKTNQNENFYDHSYIEFIQGRPRPDDGTELLIHLQLFRPDSSGEYHMFTVNSYSDVPITNIPVFRGKNKVYDLRNCVDFRPYRLPISGFTYSSNALSPDIIDSDTINVGLPEITDISSATNFLFENNDEYIVPVLNSTGRIDYDFYLNRTDSLVIDSYGSFNLVKGNESIKSSAPKTDGTTIAEVYIPGYPLYTLREAKDQGRPDYGIKINDVSIKNYTMKDIKKIDDQIEKLRYYVVLSQLEADTKNLRVKDENGLERFKNGIIVDPFNDLNIAEIRDPEFNSSINTSEKILTPSVRTIPLNLIPDTVTPANTKLFNNKVYSLENNTEVNIISQPYATSYRTCTSNFYLYSGKGNLIPNYDSGYDVTNNPTQITIDLETPFDNLLTNLHKFLPLTTSSSLTTTTSNVVGNELVTTQIIKDTVQSLQQTSTVINQNVGNFITDFKFLPYMRSKRIRIEMFGLRPNTRHYFFFDGTDVNEYVCPAIKNEEGIIVKSGSYGKPVSSDSTGTIYAMFKIPEETFLVGDRILDIIDVDDFSSVSSGSNSKGSLRYSAYNFAIESSSLTLSTRMPEIGITESTTERNVVFRQTMTQDDRGGGDGDPGDDPLAQTFFIKSGMAPNGNCVYVSKIDLYFKRKSTEENGVTVMIREVVNGYPSYEILPFSKVHLTKPQVLVSDDSSIPTTIVFEAPVRLDTEKEYAIIIMPDANDPDYLIWTSTVGGTDVLSNIAVSQDWGDGVLFTSTNNRAWKSYQNEDIKFTLYRYEFANNNSTASMILDNPEFLILDNISGRFESDEEVYTYKSNTAIEISLEEGERQANIFGTNPYNVGDFFVITNPDSEIEIKEVVEVSSGGDFIIMNEPSSFTSSSVDSFIIVKGDISYWDYRSPSFMSLEKSSANATNKFAIGDIIYGINGNGVAVIDSIIDIDVSYMQPMIYSATDRISNITPKMNVVKSSDTNERYDVNTTFGENIYFNDYGCKIYSKSNDTSLTKMPKIVFNMTNNGVNTSTPLIDVENSSILINQYDIDNAAYVSREVTLADGFDADDFRIYVTSHRPLNTNAKCFIRLQNKTDVSNTENNPWIELEMIEGIDTYCSSNLSDYREYVYEIASSDKNDGVVTYENSNGTFEGFRSFQIKILLESTNNYSVPKLDDYRGIALE